MDFRGDGVVVVRHRHRFGLVANRLGRKSESCFGVEEGIIIRSEKRVGILHSLGFYCISRQKNLY